MIDSRSTQLTPYGSWPSPISAVSLVEGNIGISELVTDGDDVWWSESRPSEGGRVAIMRSRYNEIKEITPSDSNVRTRVHEYGGGAWWVDSGVLYYVEFTDQRLRKIDANPVDQYLGEPLILTPEPPAPGSYRFADGRVTPDRRWFICVRELHRQISLESSSEPENQLVAVATDGSLEVRGLVSGADFYAYPRPSPDGSLLAWVQWSHPNMPWDGTELWLGELLGGEIVRSRLVAGGPDEAVGQPEWSSNGDLYFLSDRSGRSNVYRLTSSGHELVVGGNFDVGGPMWVFGLSRYAVATDGSLIVAMSRPEGDSLLFDSSESIENKWSTVTSVRALKTGGAAYIGSTYRAEPRAVIHISEPVVASGQDIRIVRDEYLPPPEFITFPTKGGVDSYALYYAPANPECLGLPDEKPPLLVVAHGGPTGAARRHLNLTLRYWTSRGWGLVDVDYRGSTGYGREYMRSLDGLWGVADVEDCIAAAQYLVSRGDVDPKRLAIRGGSAGGFTVLAALAFHDVFAAGASSYGIGDLEVLARETHKFESRYLDRLVGSYPQEQEVYQRRSPFHHVKQFSAPMILLQGSDDEVVPPNQAEMLVDALALNRLPHAYVLFENEGHGFRQGSNIVAALEAEYSFFAQIFGFVPDDEIPKVEVRK